MQTHAPYTIFVHERDTRNNTISQQQDFSKKIDLKKTFVDLANFAKKESGFYAYPMIDLDKKPAVQFLQVSYITSAVVHGKKVCIVS
jgi:hypothetical protein